MKNTTLCYIKKNGKYLLLYRNKKENDCNEGKWIGVGGKFEKDETKEECLLREVKEETGLTLLHFDYYGLIRFVSDVWEDNNMYLFSADSFEGELSEDCNEGELKWVDESEVLTYPTWEGDHFFLEKMLNGEKDIDMTLVYQGEQLVQMIDYKKEKIV